MDAATLQAVAALSAVLVAAAGLLAGFFYWLHRDLKQDFREEVRRLDDKIDGSNAESREEMRQMEERILRGQVELREEMRQMEERTLRGQAELREEMRRGFAQLLAALNGHTHDADTGAAIYREMPAAHDD